MISTEVLLWRYDKCMCVTVKFSLSGCECDITGEFEPVAYYAISIEKYFLKINGTRNIIIVLIRDTALILKNLMVSIQFLLTYTIIRYHNDSIRIFKFTFRSFLANQSLK